MFSKLGFSEYTQAVVVEKPFLTFGYKGGEQKQKNVINFFSTNRRFSDVEKFISVIFLSRWKNYVDVFVSKYISSL